MTNATFTWSFGTTTSAVQFAVQFNTATQLWTVNMQRGRMDLNALWWSNDDTINDGNITLVAKDNSLNMNGTNVVWDGYDKISDTGLTTADHQATDGSSKTTLLYAGKTYTYSLSKDGGVAFDPFTYDTLGVRATSINDGSGSIKAVDGLAVINYAPTAIDDSGAATEAGGTNNGTPGSNAIGNVLINDIDDNNTKTVTAVRTGAIEGSGTVGTLYSQLQGLYGKLTLNADQQFQIQNDFTPFQRSPRLSRIVKSSWCKTFRAIKF